MTDLKNKLKILSKDIFDRIDELEHHVDFLKRGLIEILTEEDIKDLPSYDLIKNTYNEYLVDKPERARSAAHKQDELYDPLYAPPKTRKRANKRQLANEFYGIAPPAKVGPAKTTAPAPAQVQVPTSDDVPSYMPDFSQSLLEGMDKSRSNRSRTPAESTPTQEVKVKVKDGNPVYIVEVQGVKYLRYDKYLYDTETKNRVGSIENGVFALNGNTNHVPFASTDMLSLTPVTDTEYYRSSDGLLFIRVGDENDIYQAVGELTADGDIGLWQ
jgi:hypothetical protein